MVLLKITSASTLKSGKAPITPFVLHVTVGVSDNLPSDDLNAQLPCLFQKKYIWAVSRCHTLDLMASEISRFMINLVDSTFSCLSMAKMY